jgi:hypothetical protein
MSWTAKIATVAKRHPWLGPVIGLVIGVLFGPGSIWQHGNLQLQRRQTSDQRVRVERELYERLQLIQNEALAEISKYIPLRDQHLANKQDYKVQNDYLVVKEKLASLIREYNRLEAKLSTIEVRSPRFFVMPIPPPAPKVAVDGTILNIEPVRDELREHVRKDQEALFEEYGHQNPHDSRKVPRPDKDDDSP